MSRDQSQVGRRSLESRGTFKCLLRWTVENCVRWCFRLHWCWRCLQPSGIRVGTAQLYHSAMHLMLVPHYAFIPHSWTGHCRLVWQVSLSYTEALYRLPWQRQCRCRGKRHAQGMTQEWRCGHAITMTRYLSLCWIRSVLLCHPVAKTGDLLLCIRMHQCHKQTDGWMTYYSITALTWHCAVKSKQSMLMASKLRIYEQECERTRVWTAWSLVSSNTPVAYWWHVWNECFQIPRNGNWKPLRARSRFCAAGQRALCRQWAVDSWLCLQWHSHLQPQ